MFCVPGQIKTFYTGIFPLFLCGFSSQSRIFTHEYWKVLLLVKDCKFPRMLGTHGHWAIRVLQLPHLLCHGTSVYMIITEDSWHSHLLPCVLPEELLLPVFNDFSMLRPGFELQIFYRQGERFNQLPHRRGLFSFRWGRMGVVLFLVILLSLTPITIKILSPNTFVSRFFKYSLMILKHVLSVKGINP